MSFNSVELRLNTAITNCRHLFGITINDLLRNTILYQCINHTYIRHFQATQQFVPLFEIYICINELTFPFIIIEDKHKQLLYFIF